MWKIPNLYSHTYVYVLLCIDLFNFKSKSGCELFFSLMYEKGLDQNKEKIVELQPYAFYQ